MIGWNFISHAPPLHAHIRAGKHSIGSGQVSWASKVFLAKSNQIISQFLSELQEYKSLTHTALEHNGSIPALTLGLLFHQLKDFFVPALRFQHTTSISFARIYLIWRAPCYINLWIFLFLWEYWIYVLSLHVSHVFQTRAINPFVLPRLRHLSYFKVIAEVANFIACTQQFSKFKSQTDPVLHTDSLLTWSIHKSRS